jgi:hypothetical protein
MTAMLRPQLGCVHVCACAWLGVLGERVPVGINRQVLYGIRACRLEISCQVFYCTVARQLCARPRILTARRLKPARSPEEGFLQRWLPHPWRQR